MRDLIDYTYIIPAILIALTIHEFSHAYVAYLFGDDTARRPAAAVGNSSPSDYAGAR